MSRGPSSLRAGIPDRTLAARPHRPRPLVGMVGLRPQFGTTASRPRRGSDQLRGARPASTAAGVRARMRRSSAIEPLRDSDGRAPRARPCRGRSARHLPQTREPGPHPAPQRHELGANVSRIDLGSGRGPTRLMSPRSTLTSCGSSSMLRRRAARAAAEAMRGSELEPVEPLPLGVGRRVAGQELVEQLVAVDDHRPQLEQPNGRPSRPSRSSRKSTGPRSRTPMATAVAATQRGRGRGADQRHDHVEAPLHHSPPVTGTGGRRRRPPRARPRSWCPGARAGGVRRPAGGRGRARSGRAPSPPACRAHGPRRAPPTGAA